MMRRVAEVHGGTAKCAVQASNSPVIPIEARDKILIVAAAARRYGVWEWTGSRREKPRDEACAVC